MINWFNNIRQQAKVAAGILDNRVYTGPWNVQIDLTNQCNNDCIACWCNSPLLGSKAMNGNMKKQMLPYETVIKLIGELHELGVREIYFTGGGEPFMHPKILDIMRFVKSKGIHLDMSTNFTLVDEKTAEQLIDIGIDHMTLSLWSATAETYSRQHPNKNQGTFHRMTQSIDYIGNHKQKYKTKCPALGMYNVINVYNYHEVDKMLEYAFEHKMNDIRFTPVDTVPGRTDHLKLDTKQRKELAQKLRRMPENIKQFEKKYRHGVQVMHPDHFLKRIESDGAEFGNYDTELLNALTSCFAGWSFARILATGDVNSCLKSFKIPIGNIHEKSFKEIWFGTRQQEFRKHTIHFNPHNPYFLNMGNDKLTDNQGCYKCCDNLGLNMFIHKRISKLGVPGRHMLKVIRPFL